MVGTSRARRVVVISLAVCDEGMLAKASMGVARIAQRLRDADPKGRGNLTAHNAYVLFVFGEVLDGKVRPGFFQGRKGVVWICDAGVFEARESVVVAVEGSWSACLPETMDREAAPLNVCADSIDESAGGKDTYIALHLFSSAIFFPSSSSILRPYESHRPYSFVISFSY